MDSIFWALPQAHSYLKGLCALEIEEWSGGSYFC